MTNSENKNTAPDTPIAEEQIRFLDGNVVLGYRNPGDRFVWGDHKWTKVNSAQRNVTLLSTAENKFYAVGRGLLVELPALNKETGKFGRQDEVVNAIELKDLPSIQGKELDDIILGKPWTALKGIDQAPIANVMVRWKNSLASPVESNQQIVTMVSPLESAQTHVDRIYDLIYSDHEI